MSQITRLFECQTNYYDGEQIIREREEEKENRIVCEGKNTEKLEEYL